MRDARNYLIVCVTKKRSTLDSVNLVLSSLSIHIQLWKERCRDIVSKKLNIVVYSLNVFFAPVSRFMFLILAVSSSSKRARGASNFNSAILPAMSLIIEWVKPPGENLITQKERDWDFYNESLYTITFFKYKFSPG